MKRELFRNNVKWAGLMVLVHIGAMIIFGIFFSATLAKFEDNDMIAFAHQRAFWGDITLWALFSLFYFKISFSFTDCRRELKDTMKEESFSLIGYYKKRYLREDIWRMGILAAFQLPFIVFYAILGLSYLYSTPIEQFYILEAGFYGTSGSAILGVLLCTAVFTVIYLFFRFLFLFLTVRSIKKY